MRRFLHLPLLPGVCALLAGCAFFKSPAQHALKLGADRILTDAEVQKAMDLITEADALWVGRGEPGKAEKALETLKASLAIAPNNTAALWRAARATYWLAERAGDAKQKEKQLELAKEGIGHAKRATYLDTDGKAGYYYLALNYAMQADATPSTGLALVKPMLEALKKADNIGSGGFDYSGPDRVMGQIYLHAPPWPTSVGDVDEAIDHLEDACDDHPECPDNNLALGEAYIRVRKYNDARKHLTRVLNTQPAPDWAPELPRLQQRARELLAKIPPK
jgi:tetratricopeptide (TPR) repeat protein